MRAKSNPNPYVGYGRVKIGIHEGYWGLMEPPFGQVPDARFFYMCEAHEDAILMLHYGLSRNKGAVLVTGAHGMGKTVLCRKLLSLLDPGSMQVASIPGNHLDAGDFAGAICAELGVQCQSKDRQTAFQELKKHLKGRYYLGKKTTVFVDDAHLIEKPETFAELRMLLGLQTDGQFLVNIVLAGRSDLVEQLALFEDLDQMFAVRERLEPLSLFETHELICHRLKTAGYIGDPNLFSPEAMLDLHNLTGGVPRLVCQLADRALALGKQKRCKAVTAELIRDATTDIYGLAMEDAA